MRLLVTEDSTTLSYWLNWRFLLCAIWVLTPMLAALFLIWKYERPSKHSESDRGGKHNQRWNDDAWRPCLKGIPPSILMGYRVIAFCLLLVALSFDVAVHGGGLFFYYTQWTFTLVTIYFGLGSLLSLYGCCQHKKMNSRFNDLIGVDTEKGSYMPLACEGSANGKMVGDLDNKGKLHISCSAGLWSNLFQILFQMTAGAVMLTDGVYWAVIFPFLTIKDYEMSFLTVVAHSLNAILLLGDTALNSLHFPWFRISYFILWTGIYVIFQWTIHAFVPLWWPYPFLDLSLAYAPLWYLVVALLHIPCYSIFALIVNIKEYVLFRWFSQSYCCQR
ncbi:hypothetical protein ACH5RR_011062 [Cinchona calisaya]|uniref:Transmembrane protein n=1 Tax=Cinchona calisaya TaxID=153742 RepID=A0ABD3A690_9GENT